MRSRLFWANELVALRLLRLSFTLRNYISAWISAIASSINVRNFPMLWRICIILRLSSPLLILTLQISCSPSFMIIMTIISLNYHKLLISSSLSIIMSSISSAWEYLSRNSSWLASLVLFIISTVDRCDRISSLQNNWCSCCPTMVKLIVYDSSSWVTLLWYYTNRCLSQSCHWIISILSLIWGVFFSTWRSLTVAALLFNDNLMASSRCPSSSSWVVMMICSRTSNFLFRLVRR